MTTLLETLLESPKLPLYQQQIEAILRAEGQRRQHFYDTVTEQEKAEFINGEIIVHSPAKFEHTTAAKLLLRLLDTYVDHHQLGFVGYEKMLITLTRNDYEPDICYFGNEKAATFTAKQMQFPAPDLVVEVLSPSTAGRDRGIKAEDYAAHGVAEYWLIDPDTQTVEQYRLSGEVYELLTKARTGTLTSVAIPGFEIPIRAIFDRDENLDTLRTILT